METETHPNSLTAPATPTEWFHRTSQFAEQSHMDPHRIRSLTLLSILAPLLPSGLIKGGSSLLLRADSAPCRPTADCDIARPKNVPLHDYLRDLRANLQTGLHGYTARIEQYELADFELLPSHYIMQRLDLHFQLNSQPLLTLPVEIGCDEIGETQHADHVLTEETRTLFAHLGLPTPPPAPLLPVEYQIAQKLHGCTSLHGRKRANDLIDMQLLMKTKPDLRRIRIICEHMFPFRRQHAFPPHMTPWPEWRGTYETTAAGLGILPTLAEALAWGKRLILDIDAAY